MTTLMSNDLFVTLELIRVTTSRRMTDILKYVVEQSFDGV